MKRFSCFYTTSWHLCWTRQYKIKRKDTLQDLLTVHTSEAWLLLLSPACNSTPNAPISLQREFCDGKQLVTVQMSPCSKTVSCASSWSINSFPHRKLTVFEDDPQSLLPWYPGTLHMDSFRRCFRAACPQLERHTSAEARHATTALLFRATYERSALLLRHPPLTHKKAEMIARQMSRGWHARREKGLCAGKLTAFWKSLPFWNQPAWGLRHQRVRWPRRNLIRHRLALALAKAKRR